MSVVCPIFVIQICRQAAMFWLNISWVASVLLPFLLYMQWAKLGNFLFVQLGNWLDQGILWVPDWAQLLASQFTAHLNFRPIRVPYFWGGFFDLLCEPIFVLARGVSELAFSSFCFASEQEFLLTRRYIKEALSRPVVPFGDLHWRTQVCGRIVNNIYANLFAHNFSWGLIWG